MADAPDTDPDQTPAPEADAGKEDTQMEFHKPKPVHNWREFLTEIGVVVIGICIALAAEQTVEWLHWQGEVAAARTALKAEIANNDLWFARRVAIAPCIDWQVQEVGRILADLEAGRQVAPFTNFHPNYGSLLNDSEWQSERAATTLTHFPRKELAVMSLYYGLLPSFHDWLDMGGEAGEELAVLQDPPPNITVSDLLRLRTALGRLSQAEELIVLRAPYMLRYASQLGVPPPAPDPKFVKQYCTLSAVDFSRLVRSQDDLP